MADMKNVVECLHFLKEVGKVVKEVSADGNVSIWDIPKLAPLWTPAQAAIADVQKVVEELKDIDGDEAKMLLTEIVDVLKVWAEIFSAQIPVILQTVKKAA